MRTTVRRWLGAPALLAAVLAATALAAPGSAPAGAAAPSVPSGVRVMPLGDSITAGSGSSTGSGYRAELWRRLAAGGYGVDFVGSMSSGVLPDIGNEGHLGWTIRQLAARVDGWLTTYQPDVVLLHIGTNDIKDPRTAPGAGARLNALVNQIRRAAPAATVFVAEIVPTADAAANERVARYNDDIAGIVASKHSSQVRLVDQFHSVTRTDLADRLHPGDSGYLKMAAAWYSAITPTLRRGVPVRTALNMRRCIDTGADPVNGAPVRVSDCHGGSNSQRWTRQRETLRLSGMCLDLPGDETANGTKLQFWSCNGEPNKRWRLRPDGSIVNPASGRCADVPVSDPPRGTQLILWDCHGSPNQTWVT